MRKRSPFHLHMYDDMLRFADERVTLDIQLSLRDALFWEMYRTYMKIIKTILND